MQGIVCDRCGEGLLIQENVRYVLTLEVTAAYDPLEITSEDLKQDLAAEIEEVIQDVSARSAADLEREIHHRARYDLCGACQKAFLKNPLGETS